MAESDESQSIHPLHDRFVKDFLHEPAEAAAVFQTALPELAAVLPWPQLRQEPCEFIDEMLGQKTSDLLFSLPLGEGRLGLLLLFDHLSNPQRNLLLRLHQYKGAAWAHQIKKGEKPGPIVAVVLYHGKEVWNPQRTMAQWFKLTPAEEPLLAKYMDEGEYAFLDLSRIDVEALEIRAYTRMVLSLLKSMGEGKELEWLERNVRFLDELLQEPDRKARVGTLIRYCLQASARLDYAAFQTKLNQIRYEEVKRTAMSIADMLMERGREEGRAEGQAAGERRGELIGRIDVLERILRVELTAKEKLQRLSMPDLEERVRNLERQCFR
jgi:predicted transposase/invertase (TIGR01784 family)